MEPVPSHPSEAVIVLALALAVALLLLAALLCVYAVGQYRRDLQEHDDQEAVRPAAAPPSVAPRDELHAARARRDAVAMIAAATLDAKAATELWEAIYAPLIEKARRMKGGDDACA